MRRIVVNAILIALVLLLGGFAALQQVSRSSTFQFFGELVPRINTSQKVVALTFDDGPTANGTELISGLETF